jgi:hypothetical protein
MLWRHFRREVTHCEFFETKPALLAAAQQCFERFNQCPRQILSVIGSNAKKVSCLYLNLSTYHREHEKFYAQNPLQQAMALQQASRVLLALADRWQGVEAKTSLPGRFPYLGCEDLNETAAIQQSGVLFLEGEGEPPEITRLKRDLGSMAEDFGETGQWLANAMQASWQAALPLLQLPALASVLGERHRIIVNDWQSAQQSSLISSVIKRAVEIVEQVDFAPSAIRADLNGPRVFPDYLYAAAELVNRAADLASESACLTHDNERRWRVFHQRVQQVLAESQARAVADEDAQQTLES